MPDDFQPGPHLSPDQLSAFAENALPAHERNAALAHMAGCAECRRVVFLIQQADPALAAVPETPRRSWLTLPQIFTAATAALACSLILALILHHQHQQPQPVTTAQLQPQAVVAPPPPATPTQPAAAHTTATTPPKPAEGKFAQLTPATTRPRLPEPAKLVPPAKLTMPQPHIGMSEGADRGRSTGAMQQATEDNAAAGTFAALPPTARSSAGVGGGVAMPAPPAAPAPEARALRAYAADNLQKDLPPASASTSGAAQPIYDLGAANRSIHQEAKVSTASVPPAAPINLPSKLAAASVLSSAGRTLALDTAGTLFVSSDRGKHWTTVTPQWSGKVERIALASGPPRLYQVQPSQTQTQAAGSTNAGALNGIQQQQAPIPAAGFELTTATGAVWVSTDGLTWHSR